MGAVGPYKYPRDVGCNSGFVLRWTLDLITRRLLLGCIGEIDLRVQKDDLASSFFCQKTGNSVPRAAVRVVAKGQLLKEGDVIVPTA